MALQSAEAVDFFDSLADLVHALEAVSFADAHLAPRASARIEVYEIDRLAPGPDDEDGPRALLKPAPSDTHPALAAFDHSMTMACATAALGGRSQHWSYRASNLRLAQTAHVRRVLPALDEVVTLAGRLLPHPTLFTDTLPYLRTMVRTDDALAAADAAAAASGALRFNRAGRVVRGASRGYDRHIVMQEGALREMAAGGLWDWE
jgi:hypothetical protein